MASDDEFEADFQAIVEELLDTMLQATFPRVPQENAGGGDLPIDGGADAAALLDGIEDEDDEDQDEEALDEDQDEEALDGLSACEPLAVEETRQSRDN